MLDELPHEIILYHIFPHLDQASQIVLSHVLYDTPLPDEISTSLKITILGYSPQFIQVFYPVPRFRELGELFERVIVQRNLPAVKWLATKFHPDYLKLDSHTSLAAWAGDLEILQFLHQSGSSLSENTAYRAIQSGKLEIVQWLLENGCPWNNRLLHAARQSGKTEIFNWCRQL